MILAFPGGLCLFLVILAAATSFAEEVTSPFLVAYALFAVLTSIAAAMTALTAHRVRLAGQCLQADTLLRRVRIPFDAIVALELVDRGPIEFPRRLLLVTGRTTQFLVLGWTDGFDDLLVALQHHVPAISIEPMPPWKRLLLLQWGT